MKKYSSQLLKVDRSWIIYSLLFCLYIFFMPQTGHASDMSCWETWASYIFSNGLGNVYKSGTDYMPLYHYILFIFGKFEGSVYYIERNLHYLKIITLLFDFIGGFYLIKLLREKIKNPDTLFFYSLFFFLNFFCFYNTVIWGQVDGIMVTLIFISFYYGLKEKVFPSLIFGLLSINFKVQSIIFFPLLGLILLPVFIKQFSWRKLFLWIIVLVGVEIIILFPFVLEGDIERVWNVVTGSVGKYPQVSMNAYNMWYWFIDGDLTTVSDNKLLGGITYKSWGLLLFFSMSLLALFPIVKNIYSIVISKIQKEIAIDKLMIVASLIPLLFFFLNTQMHERYAHPAIIFLAAYSIMTRRFFPYVLASFAYFLNLEKVLQAFQLHNYGTLIFNQSFIAGIYFLTIILLFFDLYQKEAIQNSFKEHTDSAIVT